MPGGERYSTVQHGTARVQHGYSTAPNRLLFYPLQPPPIDLFYLPLREEFLHALPYV